MRILCACALVLVLPVAAAAQSGGSSTRMPGAPGSVDRFVARPLAGPPAPAGTSTASGRGTRAANGALIGAGVGVVVGWLFWRTVHDCGGCEPGPAGSLAEFGVLGALGGAIIGAAIPPKRPALGGIPLTGRLSVAAAVSRAQKGAVVRVVF
jgi:hypothetical protein